MSNIVDLERFIFLHRLTVPCPSRNALERVAQRISAWEQGPNSFPLTQKQREVLKFSEYLRMLVIEGCVESAIKYHRLHPLSAFGNLDCELLFLRYQNPEVENWLAAESARLGIDSSITDWLDENIYLYGLETPPNPYDQLKGGRSLGICDENASLFLNKYTFQVGLDSDEIKKLFSCYGFGRGKAVYEAWSTDMSLEGVLITDDSEASILERVLLIVNLINVRLLHKCWVEHHKFILRHEYLIRPTVYSLEEFRLAIAQKKRGLLTKV